ncbi:unnamed protein product, partial [Rhizoctonia solani]
RLVVNLTAPLLTRPIRGRINSPETFESLLQDTANDFFIHAILKAISHNVGDRALPHQTQGNVEFMTSHPRTSYLKRGGCLDKLISWVSCVRSLRALGASLSKSRTLSATCRIRQSVFGQRGSS